MQHINELATSRLQSAADEIVGLRSENEHFHKDLTNIYASMVSLKGQVEALEAHAAPHINSEAGKSLRAGMERWKLEWRDADLRLRDRRYLYERRLSGSSDDMVVSPGNDPFVHHETKEPSATRGTTKDDRDEISEQAPANGDHPRTSTEVMPEIDDQAIVSSSEEDSEPDSPPSRTPWEELWASLTEYAGILEYD